MPQRDDRRPARRAVSPSAPARRGPGVRRVRSAASDVIPDRFFRQLVASMRNGVLAITRDGTVAEINAEACRIFQLKRTAGGSSGGRSPTCCAKHPDIVRVLHSAFELSHLPNRAELRLKSSRQGDRLHAVARARRARADRPASRCSSRT